MGDAIIDTRKRLGTLKMLDEVYLNQLEAKLSEIEPYHQDHRRRFV